MAASLEQMLAQLSSPAQYRPQSQDPTQWGMDPYGGGSVFDGSGGGTTSFGRGGAGGNFDLGSILGMFGGGKSPTAPAGGQGWLQNGATIVNGLSQLGGLYTGIKQLGLAKDAFKLQKEAYKTNLANQTKSYNTQVTDRVAGRSYNTEEERQAALKAALLPTGG